MMAAAAEQSKLTTVMPTGAPEQPYERTVLLEAISALSRAAKNGKGGTVVLVVLASATFWGLHELLGGRAQSERLNAQDDRLDAQDQRLGSIEARLDAQDGRLGGIESRLGSIETDIDSQGERLSGIEMHQMMQRWSLSSIARAVGAELPPDFQVPTTTSTKDPKR